MTYLQQTREISQKTQEQRYNFLLVAAAGLVAASGFLVGAVGVDSAGALTIDKAQRFIGLAWLLEAVLASFTLIRVSYGQASSLGYAHHANVVRHALRTQVPRLKPLLRWEPTASVKWTRVVFDLPGSSAVLTAAGAALGLGFLVAAWSDHAGVLVGILVFALILALALRWSLACVTGVFENEKRKCSADPETTPAA